MLWDRSVWSAVCHTMAQRENAQLYAMSAPFMGTTHKDMVVQPRDDALVREVADRLGFAIGTLPSEGQLTLVDAVGRPGPAGDNQVAEILQNRRLMSARDAGGTLNAPIDAGIADPLAMQRVGVMQSIERIETAAPSISVGAVANAVVAPSAAPSLAINDGIAIRSSAGGRIRRNRDGASIGIRYALTTKTTGVPDAVEVVRESQLMDACRRITNGLMCNAVARETVLYRKKAMSVMLEQHEILASSSGDTRWVPMPDEQEQFSYRVQFVWRLRDTGGFTIELTLTDPDRDMSESAPVSQPSPRVAALVRGGAPIRRFLNLSGIEHTFREESIAELKTQMRELVRDQNISTPITVIVGESASAPTTESVVGTGKHAVDFLTPPTLVTGEEAGAISLEMTALAALPLACLQWPLLSTSLDDEDAIMRTMLETYGYGFNVTVPPSESAQQYTEGQHTALRGVTETVSALLEAAHSYERSHQQYRGDGPWPTTFYQMLTKWSNDLVTSIDLAVTEMRKGIDIYYELPTEGFDENERGDDEPYRHPAYLATVSVMGMMRVVAQQMHALSRLDSSDTLASAEFELCTHRIAMAAHLFNSIYSGTSFAPLAHDECTQRIAATLDRFLTTMVNGDFKTLGQAVLRVSSYSGAPGIPELEASAPPDLAQFRKIIFDAAPMNPAKRASDTQKTVDATLALIYQDTDLSAIAGMITGIGPGALQNDTNVVNTLMRAAERQTLVSTAIAHSAHFDDPEPGAAIMTSSCLAVGMAYSMELVCRSAHEQAVTESLITDRPLTVDHDLMVNALSTAIRGTCSSVYHSETAIGLVRKAAWNRSSQIGLVGTIRTDAARHFIESSGCLTLAATNISPRRDYATPLSNASVLGAMSSTAYHAESNVAIPHTHPYERGPGSLPPGMALDVHDKAIPAAQNEAADSIVAALMTESVHPKPVDSKLYCPEACWQHALATKSAEEIKAVKATMTIDAAKHVLVATMSVVNPGGSRAAAMTGIQATSPALTELEVDESPIWPIGLAIKTMDDGMHAKFFDFRTRKHILVSLGIPLEAADILLDRSKRTDKLVDEAMSCIPACIYKKMGLSDPGEPSLCGATLAAAFLLCYGMPHSHTTMIESFFRSCLCKALDLGGVGSFRPVVDTTHAGTRLGETAVSATPLMLCAQTSSIHKCGVAPNLSPDVGHQSLLLQDAGSNVTTWFTTRDPMEHADERVARSLKALGSAPSDETTPLVQWGKMVELHGSAALKVIGGFRVTIVDGELSLTADGVGLDAERAEYLVLSASTSELMTHATEVDYAQRAALDVLYYMANPTEDSLMTSAMESGVFSSTSTGSNNGVIVVDPLVAENTLGLRLCYAGGAFVDEGHALLRYMGLHTIMPMRNTDIANITDASTTVTDVMDEPVSTDVDDLASIRSAMKHALCQIIGSSTRATMMVAARIVSLSDSRHVAEMPGYASVQNASDVAGLTADTSLELYRSLPSKDAIDELKKDDELTITEKLAVSLIGLTQSGRIEYLVSPPPVADTPAAAASDSPSETPKSLDDIDAVIGEEDLSLTNESEQFPESEAPIGADLPDGPASGPSLEPNLDDNLIAAESKKIIRLGLNVGWTQQLFHEAAMAYTLYSFGNPNLAYANLLAGSIVMAVDGGLRFWPSAQNNYFEGMDERYLEVAWDPVDKLWHAVKAWNRGGAPGGDENNLNLQWKTQQALGQYQAQVRAPILAAMFLGVQGLAAIGAVANFASGVRWTESTFVGPTAAVVALHVMDSIWEGAQTLPSGGVQVPYADILFSVGSRILTIASWGSMMAVLVDSGLGQDVVQAQVDWAVSWMDVTSSSLQWLGPSTFIMSAYVLYQTEVINWRYFRQAMKYVMISGATVAFARIGLSFWRTMAGPTLDPLVGGDLVVENMLYEDVLKTCAFGISALGPQITKLLAIHALRSQLKWYRRVSASQAALTQVGRIGDDRLNPVDSANAWWVAVEGAVLGSATVVAAGAFAYYQVVGDLTALMDTPEVVGAYPRYVMATPGTATVMGIVLGLGAAKVFGEYATVVRGFAGRAVLRMYNQNWSMVRIQTIWRRITPLFGIANATNLLGNQGITGELVIDSADAVKEAKGAPGRMVRTADDEDQANAWSRAMAQLAYVPAGRFGASTDDWAADWQIVKDNAGNEDREATTRFAFGAAVVSAATVLPLCRLSQSLVSGVKPSVVRRTALDRNLATNRLTPQNPVEARQSLLQYAEDGTIPDLVSQADAIIRDLEARAARGDPIARPGIGVALETSHTEALTTEKVSALVDKMSGWISQNAYEKMEVSNMLNPSTCQEARVEFDKLTAAASVTSPISLSTVAAGLAPSVTTWAAAVTKRMLPSVLLSEGVLIPDEDDEPGVDITDGPAPIGAAFAASVEYQGQSDRSRVILRLPLSDDNSAPLGVQELGSTLTSDNLASLCPVRALRDGDYTRADDVELTSVASGFDDANHYAGADAAAVAQSKTEVANSLPLLGGALIGSKLYNLFLFNAQFAATHPGQAIDYGGFDLPAAELNSNLVAHTTQVYSLACMLAFGDAAASAAAFAKISDAYDAVVNGLQPWNPNGTEPYHGLLKQVLMNMINLVVGFDVGEGATVGTGAYLAMDDATSKARFIQEYTTLLVRYAFDGDGYRWTLPYRVASIRASLVTQIARCPLHESEAFNLLAASVVYEHIGLEAHIGLGNTANGLGKLGPWSEAELRDKLLWDMLRKQVEKVDPITGRDARDVWVTRSRAGVEDPDGTVLHPNSPLMLNEHNVPANPSVASQERLPIGKQVDSLGRNDIVLNVLDTTTGDMDRQSRLKQLYIAFEIIGKACLIGNGTCVDKVEFMHHNTSASVHPNMNFETVYSTGPVQTLQGLLSDIQLIGLLAPSTTAGAPQHLLGTLNIRITLQTSVIQEAVTPDLVQGRRWGVSGSGNLFDRYFSNRTPTNPLTSLSYATTMLQSAGTMTDPVEGVGVSAPAIVFANDAMRSAHMRGSAKFDSCRHSDTPVPPSDLRKIARRLNSHKRGLITWPGNTALACINGSVRHDALALTRAMPSVEAWANIASYSPQGHATAVSAMQTAAVASALQKQQSMGVIPAQGTAVFNESDVMLRAALTATAMEQEADLSAVATAAQLARQTAPALGRVVAQPLAAAARYFTLTNAEIEVYKTDATDVANAAIAAGGYLADPGFVTQLVATFVVIMQGSASGSAAMQRQLMEALIMMTAGTTFKHVLVPTFNYFWEKAFGRQKAATFGPLTLGRDLRDAGWPGYVVVGGTATAWIVQTVMNLGRASVEGKAKDAGSTSMSVRAVARMGAARRFFLETKTYVQKGEPLLVLVPELEIASRSPYTQYSTLVSSEWHVATRNILVGNAVYVPAMRSIMRSIYQEVAQAPADIAWTPDHGKPSVAAPLTIQHTKWTTASSSNPTGTPFVYYAPHSLPALPEAPARRLFYGIMSRIVPAAERDSSYFNTPFYRSQTADKVSVGLLDDLTNNAASKRAYGDYTRMYFADTVMEPLFASTTVIENGEFYQFRSTKEFIEMYGLLYRDDRNNNPFVPVAGKSDEFRIDRARAKMVVSAMVNEALSKSAHTQIAKGIEGAGNLLDELGLPAGAKIRMSMFANRDDGPGLLELAAVKASEAVDDAFISGRGSVITPAVLLTINIVSSIAFAPNGMRLQRVTRFVNRYNPASAAFINRAETLQAARALLIASIPGFFAGYVSIATNLLANPEDDVANWSSRLGGAFAVYLDTMARIAAGGVIRRLIRRTRAATWVNYRRQGRLQTDVVEPNGQVFNVVDAEGVRDQTVTIGAEGWLTQLAKPNPTYRAMRLQYAVEVTNLLCVSQFAQCTDPINETEGKVEEVRYAYDQAGLRVHLASTDGGGKRDGEISAAFNKALIYASSVELPASYMDRKRSEARFTDISQANVPFAFVGYSQLFGTANASRAIAPLAHATVCVNCADNKTVSVSDALRGAACGYIQPVNSRSTLAAGAVPWGNGDDEHAPRKMLGREKLVPLLGEMTIKPADLIRSYITMRVSCAESNPTMTEFVLLCKRTTILDALRSAVARGELNVLPPCAQALRRTGLVELGHMLPVLHRSVSYMPVIETTDVTTQRMTTALDTGAFANAAATGINERSMRSIETGNWKRVGIPVASADAGNGDVAGVVTQLWEAKVYDNMTLLVGFVPFTSYFTCVGVDDVLLATSTNLALEQLNILAAQVELARGFTTTLQQAITETANNEATFKAPGGAVSLAVKAGLVNPGFPMVPVVRSHYNALLPRSATRAGLHEYDSYA